MSGEERKTIVHRTYAEAIAKRSAVIADEHGPCHSPHQSRNDYAPAPMSSVRTCTVIRSGETHWGKQGLSYVAGISAESAGARGICMHLLTISPGTRAKAYLHANHETTIYVLSGESEMGYGEGLRQHLVVRAGDFLYIPAGMPHLPANRSQTEPCIAVIARTDPNEQESVVLLPELDAQAEVSGCNSAHEYAHDHGRGV
jgi:uncharacterized RmlC-like cupin family protein